MKNSGSFVSQKFGLITINLLGIYMKKIQEIRHLLNAVCVVYIYYLSKRSNMMNAEDRKQNTIGF